MKKTELEQILEIELGRRGMLLQERVYSEMIELRAEADYATGQDTVFRDEVKNLGGTNLFMRLSKPFEGLSIKYKIDLHGKGHKNKVTLKSLADEIISKKDYDNECIVVAEGEETDSEILHANSNNIIQVFSYSPKGEFTFLDNHEGIDRCSIKTPEEAVQRIIRFIDKRMRLKAIRKK